MKSSVLFLLILTTAIAAAQDAPGRPGSASYDVTGTEILRSSLTSHGSAPVTPGEDAESAGSKNVGTAILYSLALPGMGELYAGDYSTGKYFTIAEGALWVTLLAFDRYATWIQDDARSFAVQHAGVAMAGQGDQFYADIGNYSSVQAYNVQKLRERDVFSLYNEKSVYSWKWDNELNLQTYRDQRIRSDEWFNNTRFVVAAILVNHVVSAINAARITIAANEGSAQTGALDIHAQVTGGMMRPDGIKISFTRTF